MGFAEKLARQALGLSQKAIEHLLSDQDRAMKVAEAIGKVQRGKAALEKGQDELLRQLNLAPKSDFKAVGKTLAGLKRRVRELNERLEEEG